MNFKQFRSPANGHPRKRNGRGSRGYRLQSKLGKTISLRRLEFLLAAVQQPVSTGRADLTKGGVS